MKVPQEDRSERIFDVPSLDVNTLMSFACERLQVCFSSASQLVSPELQQRRAEPMTVALEALRKLRFRSDAVEDSARTDLVPAMNEVLRALTMENSKVHLLEISGLPAEQSLSACEHTPCTRTWALARHPCTHLIRCSTMFVPSCVFVLSVQCVR